MSIIQYKEIELTDILYFKNAKFVFKNGITIVRGLNSNGDVDKNTNGVGKSLLFSCIPNIRYATTPLAKKNDKKSLFQSKSSQIKFKIKKEGVLWTIIQKASKSGIGYDILKDGVSIKPRTTPIAEAKIKELFGTSEELFYTKDYISIQRPHLFLRGTPTQRQEFFTEVFKLDYYDNLKSSFLSQLRELRAKKIKLELLKEQLVDVSDKLTSINWGIEKEESINELETKLGAINTEYLSAMTILDDLQAQYHLAIAIAKCESKISTNKQIKPSIESLKLKKKELRELIAQSQEYSEYLRAKKRYTKNTESLTERLSELTSRLEKEGDTNGTSKLSTTDIDASLEKLYDRRRELKSQVKRLNELRDEYSNLSEPGIKKPALTLEQLTTRIGELEQIIELHGFVKDVSKKCPLCGSRISKDSFNEIAKRAIDELPRCKKDLADAKIFKRLKEIKKEASEYTGADDILDVVEAKIQKLETSKVRAERITSLQSSISELEKSISRIKKPKAVDKPDTDYDESILESKLQRCDREIQLLADLADLHSERTSKGWTEQDPKQLSKKIESLKNKQSKTVSKINKINEILPELLTQQHQIIEHTKTKLDLQTKISTLETQLSDVPILEALIKAYGSKGLKVDVMRRIGALVEGNLNKYSGLIFAEKFTFKIDIAENSFSVLVDRLNGNISDISKLSGYEGSAFTLLLLLSMLPLIPRKMRSDCIILDEVDALMGPPLKKLFFTKFLPILNTVVPKVVCIVTSHLIDVENARNILIEKNGTESTIKEIYELGGLA